jgi:membrane fusion protein, multidrug efflux system
MHRLEGRHMVRVLFVILIGCLTMTSFVAPSWAGKTDSKSAATKVAVKTVRIGGRAAGEPVTGMGSVSCARNVDLGFDETGLVSEILVDEGDGVKPRQLLAKLDDSVVAAEKIAIEAKIQAAQSEVAHYRGDLKNKESLYQRDALSDAELKKASFELQKAEAVLAMAKAELAMNHAKHARRFLYAPNAGIITHRYVDVGSVIMPGSSKVVRLVQCEEAFADVELGEKLYPVIPRSKQIAVEVDALPGKVFQGQLKRIGVEIDKKNRTFPVRIRIANPDLMLRPGMFVRAKIQIPGVEEPIWTPKKALLTSGTRENAVFVVRDGVALRRPVVLANVAENKAYIAKGLEKGDMVVVEGQERLSDLAEVNAELLEGE